MGGCVFVLSADSEDRKEGAAVNGDHSNHTVDSDDSNDDLVDYFEDLPADEQGDEVRYADFFDPPDDEFPPDSNEYGYGIGDNETEQDNDEASMDSEFEMGMESDKMTKLQVDAEDEEENSDREEEEEEEGGVASVLSSHEERLAKVSGERSGVGDGRGGVSGERSGVGGVRGGVGDGRVVWVM